MEDLQDTDKSTLLFVRVLRGRVGACGGRERAGERGVFALGVLPESTVGVCDPLPKNLTILSTNTTVTFSTLIMT